MSAARQRDDAVAGRVDAEGRLVAADPPLAALQAQAGGDEGGMLAVPQIAALARLARRLGITISRAALAADGEQDVDLWVRAEPQGDEIALAITGWSGRPPRAAAPAAPAEREADFLRAAADWMWETDDTLRLTQLSPGAAAAIGRNPAEFDRQAADPPVPLPRERDGALPILTALAEHKGFEGQLAELRGGRKGRYLLVRRAADRRHGAVRRLPRRRHGAARPARRPAPPTMLAPRAQHGNRLRRAARSGAARPARPYHRRCRAAARPARGPAAPRLCRLCRRHRRRRPPSARSGRRPRRPAGDRAGRFPPRGRGDRPRRHRPARRRPAARARRRPQCHDRRPGRRRDPAGHRRFHPRAPDHDEPDHQRHPLHARRRPGLAAPRAGRAISPR